MFAAGALVARALGGGLLPEGAVVGASGRTAECNDAIATHFKGALPGTDVDARVFDVLSARGFTAANTLFAQSTCSDEVNHDNGAEDISLIMAGRYGEVFNLGGLAGLPFTGKTGWGAFSGHVPVNGNIVVLIAPHVGVASDGTVGKVKRPGQDGLSTACGASVGAFSSLVADPEQEDFGSGYCDHQIDCIKHLLRPHVEQLRAVADDNTRMAHLAYATYGIARQFLHEMVSYGWCGEDSKLAVLGGVMINCDGDNTDVFLPLDLSVHTADGESDSLFDEAFAGVAFAPRPDLAKF